MNKTEFYSNGTQDCETLVRAHATLTILSNVVKVQLSSFCKKVIGIVLSSTVYFCRTMPITLSTWIRTEAKTLDVSTSEALSCCFPFVKAGILSSALQNATESEMVNPRSASIRSPGKMLFKKPQFSVKYTSLVLPPHPLEMNVMTPCGAILIKYFTVLWDLYWE